ncbi:hypothetical protein TNCV_3512171 [Trichonephila clavipes]|nr:hypothetical protein TNCV_3512171 [Trichonephila clavipes]
MVSGNKNNNDPPPSNINNRSERQSTPRASPSNEINASDFQDVIDLFKIVTNIFKQFPKSNRVPTFNLLVRHWSLTYWPHLFNHRTKNNSTRHPQIQIWDGGICLGSTSQIESRSRRFINVTSTRRLQEDFGKRNMPEIVVGVLQWTREGTTRGKSGLERPGRPRGDIFFCLKSEIKGSKDRA